MADQGKPADRSVRVVFVTGPSGAGRSTAINALEDLGFEAIDNLPLSLLPRLLSGPPPDRPMALGTDVRNRDFSADTLLALLASLRDDPVIRPELLYLDCQPDVLQRRYSETRRRHPLALDLDPVIGIAREMEMLAPLRQGATALIDTSTLTPHELRAEINGQFAASDGGQLNVTVTSFSYRKGLPRGADLVFDCRFLANPYWDPALRAHDGRDADVQAHIAQDPRHAPFKAQVFEMLDLLLPAFRDEGKTHLTVAFGCTGGQHRSVAMTEVVHGHLAQAGWQVAKRHKEME